jgi:ankyrin repeat protein
MRWAVRSIGSAFVALVTAMAMLYGLYGLLSFILTDDLCDAARRGNIEDVKLAVSRGAKINGRGMHATTPLMAACEGGQLEIAKYLIDLGADVNGHNASGSALMWAIEAGNASLCELLCEKGADVDWKNDTGGNAIDFAATKNNKEISNILQRFTNEH